MMEAIRSGFRNYVNFQGRATRGDYWWFWLFAIIARLVGISLDATFGLTSVTSYASRGATSFSTGFTTGGGPITLIVGLALLLPLLSAAVRRLHDGNRSGWFILLPVPFYLIGILGMFGGGFGGSAALAIIGGLLMFVGLIAAVAVLVFLILPGTRGANRFGTDPRDPQGNLSEVFS